MDNMSLLRYRVIFSGQWCDLSRGCIHMLGNAICSEMVLTGFRGKRIVFLQQVLARLCSYRCSFVIEVLCCVE